MLGEGMGLQGRLYLSLEGLAQVAVLKKKVYIENSVPSRRNSLCKE